MTLFLYISLEVASIFMMYVSSVYMNKYRKEKNSLDKSKSIVFFILSFLPFFLIFSIRSIKVGADYFNYTKFYSKIISNDLSSREVSWLGIGFRQYCKMISIIVKDNYYIAYALINNITLFLFFTTIRKKSSIMWLSLFLFYSFCLHFQIFNQFRQMFAIGITFYNIVHLKENNLKKYIILTIVASLFHNTAILMLPLYWISKIKINKKIILIYIIIGLFMFFGFPIIENLMKNTYYGDVYFGSKYDITTQSTVLNFFVRVALLVVSLMFLKPVLKRDEKNIILYNMAIFCTLSQVLAMKSYIFARLTTYFFVYYILLIPELVMSFKNIKTRKIAILLIVLLFSLYQFVYYNSSSGAVGGGYSEYTTLFTDKI